MQLRHIDTWRERCDKHPDHNGVVTHDMIQARMQEEIDELRLVCECAQNLVSARGKIKTGQAFNQLAKLFMNVVKFPP